MKPRILELLSAVLLTAAVSPFSIARAELVLTAEERDWLDDIKVIRLCSDQDWMPYKAKNTADGTGL